MCYSAFLSPFGPQPLGNRFIFQLRLSDAEMKEGLLGHVWTVVREHCYMKPMCYWHYSREKSPSRGLNLRDKKQAKKKSNKMKTSS